MNGSNRRYGIKQLLRILRVFCWITLVLVLFQNYLTRFDYVYDLPEESLSLFLEKGAPLWSMDRTLEDQLSSRLCSLSGVHKAGELNLLAGQDVPVAVRGTFGSLKVGFRSGDGPLLLLEDVDDASSVSLDAGTYEIFFIGKHFWGEAFVN